MPTFELMSKLIGDKAKTPAEIVTKVVGALHSLDTLKDKALDKALDTVQRSLEQMKSCIFGDEGHEPTKANVVALAEEVVRSDLLALVPGKLLALGFETRKDAAQVFGAVVRIRDNEDKCPGAHYVEQHFEIMEELFNGYKEPSIALNCGSMFRDCIRDEGVARRVLDSDILWRFFDEVEVANFEIASDAFSSFKDLLTRHKGAIARFLADHFQRFFDAFYGLLQSSNYVTRRQSLKLLGELLLDGINVRLMMRYVSDVRNLMLMMNLLKDSSRSIQFEAFHVFKVFVANPSKPQPIIDILTNNRDKLLKYLEDFLPERDDDEQFKEEKAVILKEISKLGRSEGGTPAAAPAEGAPRSEGGGGGGEQQPGAGGSGGGSTADQQEAQQQQQQQAAPGAALEEPEPMATGAP
ncbi:MAG: Mo25-like protein [Monoraphidium minutum]|nr:MAG: Mo25-like protein [Monoraphidium minutum]